MPRIISPIPCIMVPVPAGAATGGAADDGGEGASGGAGATGDGAAGAVGWCCSCPPEGVCAATTPDPTAPARRSIKLKHTRVGERRIVTASSFMHRLDYPLMVEECAC